MDTLPDYLREGLNIVLVGLNPSVYSARRGHYFANPRNRFWPAFNRSGLVDEEVAMEADHTLINHGIGLTDVIKRPTSQASELRAQDFRRWAPTLRAKLEQYQPLIVCFHGVVAYSIYLRYAEGVRAKPILGLQDHRIGSSRVFVIPNPSPANAQYSLEVLVDWYRRLKALRQELRGQ